MGSIILMCLILNMTEKITCMLVNRQTSKMNENKTDGDFLWRHGSVMM